MSIYTDSVDGDGAVGEQLMNSGSSAEHPNTEAGGSPVANRRSSWRFLTAFRPGCVVLGDRIVLGMIRNMSANGVMIELDEPIMVGQSIGYFWDENKIVSATVAWSEGNMHGLENVAKERVFDCGFTYRSVRVPCTLKAEVWVRGDRFCAEVDNLSLGGMRIRGVRAWTGAPLTISICGIERYNATVRWTKGNRAGVRFADRLTRSQLTSILCHESVRFDRLQFD